MRRILSARSIPFAALLFWTVSTGLPARAGISYVNTFRNVAYTQTGDGATLSSAGAFFSAELNSTAPDDYLSVSLDYPGSGSPVDLPQIGPTVYHYQTGLLASQADMDAAFPVGTYQFTANTASGSDTTSVLYEADDYAESLPYLTGNDYTNLQGMNPAQAFTFHISAYETGGRADFSLIFLTVFDYGLNQFVFGSLFLPSDTTTVTMPANTLAPGGDYAYELIFSNRDIVDSPGTLFPAQLGFDRRTTGRFTTAALAPVPEPATLIAGAIGAGLYFLGRLRSRRGAKSVG